MQAKGCRKVEGPQILMASIDLPISIMKTAARTPRTPSTTRYRSESQAKIFPSLSPAKSKPRWGSTKQQLALTPCTDRLPSVPLEALFRGNPFVTLQT